LLLSRTPTAPLSPYTTLFRSVLLYRSAFEAEVHASIFPTTQGGANESGMLGKLACLLEWHERDIQGYATSIVASATTMGQQLAKDRKSTRLNSSHGSISYAVF